MNVAINIAVVIPAHNEEMVLPNLLDDLLHQSVFPYQAIVVNSSSTDGTATIVNDYAARTQWLNLVSGLPTAGAARNEGAMHASTPWLLFLDADVRIPKYFIEEFMRHVVEASSISILHALLLQIKGIGSWCGSSADISDFSRTPPRPR